MTAVIEAGDIRIGDVVTITRESIYDTGLTRSIRRVFAGKVIAVDDARQAVRLEGDNGRAEWISVSMTGIATMVIERTGRTYQPGDMYQVYIIGDHPNVVRIWTREADGWRTISGLRSDETVACRRDTTIGDRVTLTRQ